MFQDEPIFRQLTAERGDVPAQVRAAAEETLRQLRHVTDWDSPVAHRPDHNRRAADSHSMSAPPVGNPEHDPR